MSKTSSSGAIEITSEMFCENCSKNEFDSVPHKLETEYIYKHKDGNGEEDDLIKRKTTECSFCGLTFESFSGLPF